MPVEHFGSDYCAQLTAGGVFAIMVDGTPVPLLELDPEHVARIAGGAQIAWQALLEAPLTDMAAALALVAAAELVEGAEPRRPPTVTALLDRFVRLPGTEG